MKLLAHAAAELGDVRAAQSELIERAHEHLNHDDFADHPTESAVDSAVVVRSHRGRPAGVRNGEGTAPKIVLKKLSLRHKQAISLVLQGSSREDAAEVAGFVPEYITFLLQQPAAKEYIAHINRAVSTQLEALYGKSVQAIANGLNSSDHDASLKAAKLQLQTTGRLEPSGDEKQTGEDVVQAILLGVNVNIQQGGRS